MPPDEVAKLRRTRRHPRRTQFDYLHVRYLVGALERALPNLVPNAREVLDVFCGSRPYDDMMPPSAQVTGLDVSDFAGIADVVTTEFLPFDDESFDMVTCFEAFYYVPDPPAAVAEIQRVLRPGGGVVITASLPWEYDTRILEHRYTGPELADLFKDWDEVAVSENGGYAVTWATLTGRIVHVAEERAPAPLRVVLRPLLALVYLLINAVGAALDWAERRRPRTHVLPMNVMLTARRPASSGGLPPSPEQGERDLEGEVPD
jgi:SAM-dependent methyltransferase